MNRLCVALVLLLVALHESDAATDCSYNVKITADDQIVQVWFGDQRVIHPKSNSPGHTQHNWGRYTSGTLKNSRGQVVKGGYVSIQAKNCHLVRHKYWCWRGWRLSRCWSNYYCNRSKNPSMLMAHFDSQTSSGVDFTTEAGKVEVPRDNISKGRWRCTSGGKSMSYWHMQRGQNTVKAWPYAYAHTNRWGNSGNIGTLRRLGADPIWSKSNVAGGAANVWCRADDICGMCNIYGYSGQSSANVEGGCTDRANTRTIKCHLGFGHRGTVAQSVTLTNGAGFGRCLPINECHSSTTWGFGRDDRSGHPGFWKCIDMKNARRIYCKTGYSPRYFDITGRTFLKSQNQRCNDNDECKLYGNSNKPNGVASCSNSAINKRTLTCKPGYYVSGTNPLRYTRSITLTGSAAFPGCLDLDECAVHPYKKDNVLDCKNSGINQRTIRCKSGFFINGKTHSETTITLTGQQAFPGCEKKDECTIHGFNGNDANTKECIDMVAQRELVCADGFWVKNTRKTSVILNKDQIFPGCADIDECKEYGYNKDSKVDNCKNGRNERTIMCKAGYYVNGQKDNADTVTLTGNAQFTSCQDSAECTLFGFSGNGDFNPTCTEPSPNMRRIQCAAGYEVIGGKQATFVDLVDDAFFKGCRDINECTRYGYSDNDKYTNGCKDMVNAREITCLPGYKTGGDDTPTITIPADGKFMGCTEINECAVYGPTAGEGFAECIDKVNKREISCIAGYKAKSDSEADDEVTLIGNAPFEGCTDIKECEVYAFSEKELEFHGCFKDVSDERTLEKQVLKDQDDMTLASCRAACSGYKYFGAQNGKDCFCGNEVPRKMSTTNDDCSVKCAGDETTICGGPLRNSIYEVDEQGRKREDTVGCEETEINTRTITCAVGFYTAINDDDVGQAVKLIAGAEFLGCSPICGDGKKVHHETCDDGNKVSGDGCSGTDDENTIACQVEKGWTDCEHTCKPICGDGLVRGDETCDHKSDVGCNAATCRVNPGWACKEGENCEASVCGDGLKLGNEGCDDGNTESGDGCSATCEEEDGYVCNAGHLCCHTWKSGGEHVNVQAQHFYSQLRCHDSYWVPRVGNDILVYVPETLVLIHDLKLGGNVKISRSNPSYADQIKEDDEEDQEADEKEKEEEKEEEEEEKKEKEEDDKKEDDKEDDDKKEKRNEHHPDDVSEEFKEWEIVIESHVTIMGTLTVDDNCVIAFTDSGRLTLLDDHDYTEDDTFPVIETNHKQLRLTGGSLQVIGFDYDDHDLDHDDHHLGIDFFITMSGCPDVSQGSFFIDAQSIPHGSNPLPLIRTDHVCHKDDKDSGKFDDLDHMLPGSCSNIDDHFNGGHGDDDDDHHSELNIDVNHRELCGGQIAGIVLGCVFGAILLLALIFFVMSGGTGVSDDYQAL